MKNRTSLCLSRGLSRLLLAGAASAALFAATPVLALEPAGANASTQAGTKTDAPKQAKLKLKDGRVIVGEILAQTADVIRFKSKVAGIDVTTDYMMSDVEEVIKIETSTPAPADGKTDTTKTETKKPDAKADVPLGTAVKAADSAEVTPAVGEDAHRVYFAELKGKFGRNITQTLVRKLTADALKENADTIVFSLDGEWDPANERKFRGWQELFRYEELGPALTDEIQKNFPKPPRVVTWVHKAMGGASLMPLCTKEIYMTEDAMIGGMFGLDVMMQGNRTVVEKQRSLRLQHAAGWVVKGGYDVRIMYAMAVIEYVLSYRFAGDEVEFFERMPEGPNEVLLTDKGPDSMQEYVRGKGKAYLNITSKIGTDLKISKGTANTKEDLFFQMGLDRNRIDVGSAKKICDQWDRRIVAAEKELQKLMQEYQDTPVNGATYEERTQQRGKRKSTLRKMMDKLNEKDLKEVFDDAYRNELELPGDAVLQSLIDQIDVQQQNDRK